MRKFVLSENKIDCPSCDGDGTYRSSGENFSIRSNAVCIDCDGEGKIQEEFWDGDFVWHRTQNLFGWIVGFHGNKAIVELGDDGEEIKMTCSVEELEQGE